MSIKEQIQKWAKVWGSKIIILLVFISGQLFVFFFGQKTAFFLDKTMLMYLSSTNAQVLAALFGLTITGFIFFDGRLGTATISDETLENPIEVLRKSYYRSLCILSTLFVLSEILCIINITANRAEYFVFGWWNRFIVAESISLSMYTIVYIVMFVWSVVNPDKIEDASKREIDKLNKGKELLDDKAMIGNFIEMYKQIERIIAEYARKYVYNNDKNYNNMLQNIMALRLSEQFSPEFISDINALRRYRNLLVHGNENSVNKKMYDSASSILDELRKMKVKKAD